MEEDIKSVSQLILRHYTDQKSTQESLFGKNARVTPMQEAFAVLFRYLKMEKKSKNLIVSLAEKLEEEIEKEKPAENSPDFNKYLTRKAFCLTVRSNKVGENDNVEIDFELLELALTLLEPIRLSSEAVGVYTQTLNRLALGFMEKGKYEEAIKLFKQTIATFEEFKAAGFDPTEDVMSVREIFGAKKERSMFYSMIMTFSNANFHIYDCFGRLKDTKMQLKFAVPRILSEFKQREAAMFEANKMMTSVLGSGTGLNLYCICIPAIAPILKFLIDNRRFAQIDFLLAALMAKLKRQTVNTDHSEQILSCLFALWGMKIVKYSIEARDDPKFVENNPICDDVEVIEEWKDVAGNDYEKQFPTSVIEEMEELSNVFEKAKFWAIQASEISNPSPFDKTCLEELNTLAHDIAKKMVKN
ncbi:uncharacterized protein LOC134831727 [Culicoides brevitarsis]|uniref:uncharacterized protein LOC134831727 n=1 Tax=Culicoides brevitarsis TaxID=469753 RepID=UPI00307B1483